MPSAKQEEEEEEEEITLWTSHKKLLSIQSIALSVPDKIKNM